MITKTRADNALEVRLADDEQLVGWLTNIDGAKVDGRALVIRSRGGRAAASLPLRMCAFELDGLDIVRVGAGKVHELLRDKIAAYAEQSVAVARDAKIFSWSALSVSQKDYEWIFDLPTFEAFDNGAPDVSTKEVSFSIAGDSIFDGAISARKLEVSSIRGMELTGAWIDEVTTYEPVNEVWNDKSVYEGCWSPEALSSSEKDRLTHAMDAAVYGVMGLKKEDLLGSGAIASTSTKVAAESSISADKLMEDMKRLATVSGRRMGKSDMARRAIEEMRPSFEEYHYKPRSMSIGSSWGGIFTTKVT